MRTKKNVYPVRHLTAEEIAKCQKMYKPPTITTKAGDKETMTRMLTAGELKAIDRKEFFLI